MMLLSRVRQSFPVHAFVVLSFLFFGYFFRLYLASFAFKPLIYDMQSYHDMAMRLLHGEFVVDCCFKNMGFSVYLAGIYRLFGVGNAQAVVSMHIVLDLLVAFLVYTIGKRLFNPRVGLLAYALYCINPFTSAYTGLILPESVTIFVMAVIGYMLLNTSDNHNILLWLVMGIAFGLLVFIRHAYYYISLVMLIVLPWVRFRKTLKGSILIVCVLGFVVSSLYSLFGNYKAYNKVSLVPPYSWKDGFMYAMFFYEKYPELFIDPPPHPILGEIAYEFDSEPLPKAAFNKKYSSLFRSKVKAEWPLYIKILGKNMLFLWDKTHLYVYQDVFYPWDFWPLRIGNGLLIFFFLFGTLTYMLRNGRETLKSPVIVFSFSLFLYMTVAFSLISSESRHTIAYYPFLILWAAYGISQMIERRWYA